MSISVDNINYLIERIKEKPWRCENRCEKKELLALADHFNIKVSKSSKKEDLCNVVCKHLGFNYKESLKNQKHVYLNKSQQLDKKSVESVEPVEPVEPVESVDNELKEKVRTILLGTEIMRECKNKGTVREKSKPTKLTMILRLYEPCNMFIFSRF